jgi:hypothetical protein
MMRAYDVVSVLLFSVLANFIFELHIDLTTSPDWITILRLVLLAAGCIAFYLISSQLTEYWAYATAEYGMEQAVEKRARRSIQDRYDGYVTLAVRRLIVRLVASCILVAAFFLVGPLIDLA